MKQHYHETSNDEELFFIIKMIIDNCQEIVQVVSLNGRHIIIYKSPF